jgi:hypothetical protein
MLRLMLCSCAVHVPLNHPWLCSVLQQQRLSCMRMRVRHTDPVALLVLSLSAAETKQMSVLCSATQSGRTPIQRA